MTLPALFLEGRPIRLGKRIGKGGEGEVYAVEGRADQALKYYTVPDPGERAAKVRAMVRAGLAEQTRLVAYPSAVVTDPKGRFAGFLMRLVQGHQPIHHLYAPGDRKAHFPGADYRFLVRTALNAARALADVHARNCVIGDINHSGILVSDQAIVALIDADSFQITEGSSEFLCTVGVPEYTPPELQGRSLAGIRRTQNHDAFGLAVIVFQLLCMGRHPFIGTYLHGEMPQERAIAEHRFAYSRRRSVGMRPPPGTVSLGDLPPQIAAAFEAAFDPAAQRPTAAQWVGLLEEMEAQLQRCATDRLHYYASSAAECPWCRIERSVGIVLFPAGRPPIGARPTAGAPGFDIHAVWAAIEAVQLPPAEAPPPLLPPVDSAPSKRARSANLKARFQRVWNAVLLVMAAGAFAVQPSWAALWLLVGGYNLYRLFAPPRAGAALRKRVPQAVAHWETALKDWERRCGGAEVHASRRVLAEAKRELEALPVDLRTALAGYDTNRRDLQLRAYLEGHRIAPARIKGVGPGLKTVLAKWGFETAYQLNYERVLAIEGFGPAKAQALMAWRQQLAAAFVYNPRPTPADAREKDRIHRDFARKGERLRGALTRGAQELATATQAVFARWRTVDPVLVRAYRDRVQAEADDAFVNAPFGARVRRMGVGAWSIVALGVAGIAALVGSAVEFPQFVPRSIIPAIGWQAPMERFDPSRPYRVVPARGTSTVSVRRAAGPKAKVVARLGAGMVIVALGRAVAADGTPWIAYARPDGSLAYVPEAMLKPATRAAVLASCAGRPWLARALCAEPTLRQLDGALNAIYHGVRSSLGQSERTALVAAQQAWAARRDGCERQADPLGCLGDAYRGRITELEGMPTPPVVAASSAASPVPETVPTLPPVPRLRSDPATLVTPADYPPAALLAREAGRVAVQLHVTPSGAVDGCEIIATSGFADLDQTTCRLLIRRAKYFPPEDTGGQSVDAFITRNVDWRLPNP